jgi:hypothetical protein
MRIEHWNQDKLVRVEDIPDLPEQVAEQSVTDEVKQALISLRTITNGTTTLTTTQLTATIRGMARILIVLIRLQLKRFEGTD